jgi:drug/metabolite transporter (DMT)-like permease
MTATLFITLLIASLLSALLYVILKYFQKWNIYNLHGLTFNYITAATFSFFSNYEENSALLPQVPDFLPFTILIGCLFISVFYIAALTAQKCGIAVTSIAGKMSMVVPITMSFWLYGDKITIVKVIGILLALTAVVLSSIRKENKTENTTATAGKWLWILPVLLFAGSGVVDSSISISQHYFIDEKNQDIFMAFLFGSAGLIGAIATIYKRFKDGVRVEIKSIGAGVFLGITNYYSLDFLLRALAAEGAESSVVFALCNVLVVLISSLFAITLFKEKLSKANFGGLALAIISILLLSR